MPENPRPTQESRPSRPEFKNLPPKQKAEARFNFAVARAESDDAAKSMLETRPEVSFDSIDRQRKPVYNRVFSEPSMKERAEYWEPKELTFEKAKEMWKKDFSAIISTDGNKSDVRKSAIRSILPKTNTELLERNTTGINITEADTETLFNEYSNNESDVDKFMKNALDDVSDLKTLKERLDDLEWIAVGFFGENTAAKIKRQLLLEAEMRGKSADEARKVFEGKDVIGFEKGKYQTPVSVTGAEKTSRDQSKTPDALVEEKDDIKLPKNLSLEVAMMAR